MKFKIDIELVPFSTPNFVRAKMPPGQRQDGLKEAPCYHLSEIDPQVLEAMADQFKKDILEKARKGKLTTSQETGGAK